MRSEGKALFAITIGGAEGTIADVGIEVVGSKVGAKRVIGNAVVGSTRAVKVGAAVAVIIASWLLSS